MADEEILEGVNEESEPLVIETRGKWRKFSTMANVTFEVGKTYKIKVQGECLLAVSAERPTAGMQTNEITYTKEEGTDLWIYTK